MRRAAGGGVAAMTGAARRRVVAAIAGALVLALLAGAWARADEGAGGGAAREARVDAGPGVAGAREARVDAGPGMAGAPDARVDAGPGVPAAPAARVDPAAQRAALRRALALVAFDGRLGYRLVLAAPRPGVRAEADTRRRSITVYLDPADAPHRVAHDIAHELGHAWDARNLDDAGRRAYLRGRGAVGRAWWPDPRTADYATGAGDFAEVFARCHAASPEFRSRLAPAPADACAALPLAARGRW